MPSCASGMTVGDSRAGRSGLELGQAGRGRVHHHVLPAARGDHSADHRVDRVQVGAAIAVGRRAGDEDGFRLEDVADLAQAVHDEGGAGRDEVDDRFGQTEAWRDLDGARDRDDLDRDALSFEEPTGGVGVGRCHSQAAQVLDRSIWRVVGDGSGQAAATVPELADPRQLRAGLRQEVDAGDPEVGNPVADELDDVVGSDEQDVELMVLDARHEAAVVLVEYEPGIVEEPKGRFDHPSLVRDGEAEALPHAFALSSIAR